MKRICLRWLWLPAIIVLVAAAGVSAEGLFKNRRIYLSNEANRVFRFGLTGTTAGANFIALIEDAREQTVSLGDLGYWELVADPPSFLRNHDLPLLIRSRVKERFQIFFEYDHQGHDIRYRVDEGRVTVRLDDSDYYPVLLVESTTGVAKAVPADDLHRLVFFDFNSLDSDLRRYYGSVKDVVGNPGYTAHFYYYAAGNYDAYYFKTFRSVAELDTEKMGLSSEAGDLDYYQRVLDNIKARHGNDFADLMILVTRFGRPFEAELVRYAREIGLSPRMGLEVWSYADLR